MEKMNHICDALVFPSCFIRRQLLAGQVYQAQMKGEATGFARPTPTSEAGVLGNEKLKCRGERMRRGLTRSLGLKATLPGTQTDVSKPLRRLHSQRGGCFLLDVLS